LVASNLSSIFFITRQTSCGVFGSAHHFKLDRRVWECVFSIGAEFEIPTGVRNPRRHKIWRKNLRFFSLLFHIYPKKFQ